MRKNWLELEPNLDTAARDFYKQSDNHEKAQIADLKQGYQSRLREQAANILSLLSVRPVEALVLAIQATALSLEKLRGEVLSQVQDSLHKVTDIVREQNLMRGHKDSVWSVAFSPDGHYIVSCSNDKTVRLWDVQSFSEQGDNWKTFLQVACARLRYHPVFKNPQTETEKQACETCRKYLWDK